MYRFIPTAINFGVLDVKYEYLIPYFGAFIDIAKAHQLTFDPRKSLGETNSVEFSERWQEIMAITEKEINDKLDDHRVTLQPRVTWSAPDLPAVDFTIKVETLGDAEEEGMARPVVDTIFPRMFMLHTKVVQDATDSELYDYMHENVSPSKYSKGFFNRMDAIMKDVYSGNIERKYLPHSMRLLLSKEIEVLLFNDFGNKILKDRFEIRPSAYISGPNVYAEVTMLDRHTMRSIFFADHEWPLATN